MATKFVDGAFDDAACDPEEIGFVAVGNAINSLMTGQTMIQGQTALLDSRLAGAQIVNVENGLLASRNFALTGTAAHRWLAKSGSESGLMAIAGWTRTDMLVGYTRARASERAAQEAQRLNLGDLGADPTRLSYDPAG